jgi:hypothetical protein
MVSTDGGYVYIMTNRAMPDLVKIGSTKLPPEDRARQLSTTGVPAPFQVIAFYKFTDELRAERELQAMFSRQRVHSRREFFEITIDEARTALLHLSGMLREPAPASVPFQNHSTRNGENSTTSDTNASVLGLPYWTRFNEVRAKASLLPLFERAGPRFFHRLFLITPSKRNGKRNIHYEGRIRINSPQISMRLIFKTAADIKELFDLIAQDRDTVEHEIGFPLLWDRERGRYESHIAIERDDMDPRDVGEWDMQHTWLSDIVSAFEKVIRPPVAKLPRPVA